MVRDIDYKVSLELYSNIHSIHFKILTILRTFTKLTKGVICHPSVWYNMGMDGASFDIIERRVDLNE